LESADVLRDRHNTDDAPESGESEDDYREQEQETQREASDGHQADRV
jgi:hypothetical protein